MLLRANTYRAGRSHTFYLCQRADGRTVVQRATLLISPLRHRGTPLCAYTGYRRHYLRGRCYTKSSFSALPGRQEDEPLWDKQTHRVYSSAVRSLA